MCALVTGVQTCALPIYEEVTARFLQKRRRDLVRGDELRGRSGTLRRRFGERLAATSAAVPDDEQVRRGGHAAMLATCKGAAQAAPRHGGRRSEEGRVGKEGVRQYGFRWSPYPSTKNTNKQNKSKK